MKKKITLVLATLILSTACSRMSPPAKDNMLKNKTFVYLYYDSEEECLENQYDPDFFENCHQQVDFQKNNDVEIMLTDIIWRGKYTVIGDVVILSFEPNYEIPDGEMTFEILNGATLLETETDKVWKKMSGNSIWNSN